MAQQPAEPVIVLQELGKCFGDKQVLKGIDLQVSAGRILGYIGPNGAGKTTTVKILIGMLDGFSGSARVCGYDVARDPLEVKRRIGYVPEAGALYEALTPMEFLSMVGRLFDLQQAELQEKALELLRIFDLVEQADQRMTTFSKGMKQKVLIISGLIHNPEVIFLDEPLSGLDANSTVVVKELIATLARAGRTVFYCSHMMDVVERVCDRIVIVDQGRIVADGTFESLQSSAKEASLERIFTELTSAGGHDEAARRFVKVIEG
ncbi:MAG: ABC transporter ATP-binding protein [bacterium]|nr:ABC transporter ATP-binding protein [bacterium]